MRGLIFAGLLVCCLIGTSYHIVPPARTLLVTKPIDTVFLSREFGKGYYHVVYIEKNRQSRFYKYLLDFNMADDDKDLYNGNLSGLKEYFHSFKRYQLESLPMEWMELYRYKGKYYNYYPSEWGMVDRNVLTDSTLVNWNIEGPCPEAIESAKKINSRTWYLKTYIYYAGKPMHIEIKIHIINDNNKMAVWEYLGEKGINRFRIYIPRLYAKNFDIIVNHCDQSKMGEFDKFDKIDYNALLNGHQ